MWNQKEYRDSGFSVLSGLSQTDTGYLHRRSNKHQGYLKEPLSAFTPAGQPRNCAVVVFMWRSTICQRLFGGGEEDTAEEVGQGQSFKDWSATCAFRPNFRQSCRLCIKARNSGCCLPEAANTVGLRGRFYRRRFPQTRGEWAYQRSTGVR